MFVKANQDIRIMCEKNFIRHWQVAEKIGHSSEYFSKLMRTELKPELRQKVLTAIDEILKERSKP